jgi:stage III sporulation protein AG
MDFKKLFNLDKLTEKTNENSRKKMNLGNLSILVLIGILLVILSGAFKEKSIFTSNNMMNDDKNLVNLQQSVSTEAEENRIARDGEEEVEKKLKETLENIQGVGKVQVMVYFKGGEEQVPAININDSTSLTEEKDVDGGTRKITQKNDGRSIVMMSTENGTEPFVVKKYKPEVTGVCVVAEGAENNLTKLEIQKAVVNLFDLKENKVNVYPMKK